MLACSISGNLLRVEGAKHFADMLKVNTTLQSVKYAANRLKPQPKSNPRQGLRAEKRQYPMTPYCPLICSVSSNNFHFLGAKYFADMLKINTTLQSIEYAAN